MAHKFTQQWEQNKEHNYELDSMPLDEHLRRMAYPYGRLGQESFGISVDSNFDEALQRSIEFGQTSYVDCVYNEVGLDFADGIEDVTSRDWIFILARRPVGG